MVDVEEERVIAAIDVKNAALGADCQPEKYLSNSKVEPDNGLSTSELKVYGGDTNGGTFDHELDNTIEHANNNPDNSESLHNEQESNIDAPDNKQQVDSNAPLNNPPVESETHLEEPPGNMSINFEVLPNSCVVNSELQSSNDGVVIVSETQQVNEVTLSETLESNEMVAFETQQGNEVIMFEEQPSNEAVIDETHTSTDEVITEAMTENELASSTIDPNNQFSHPETHSHNHHFADFHMIPEDQLPQPESLPNGDPLPSSEPFKDNHIRDIKPIHHDHLAQYDTFPNDHLDHSTEALCNHQSCGQLANSHIMHHYELENNETLHENQLVESQEHYGIVNDNDVPMYEIIYVNTPLNSEEPTPDAQPNKKRKMKSIVWEHFTVENVDVGCRRAYCKKCNQSFAYSTGSKVVGTSHLKRHIAKGTCATLLRGQNQSTYAPQTRGTSTTPNRRYRFGGSPYINIDQDHCLHEIAVMIIMHDYPLHMVEHPGFVAFVQNLQPQFNMLTFNTIQADCIATFLSEKQNLQRYFEGLPGRFCLTLDMWTSNQSVGYVFITGHFVDNDWKLQKRILNVVMEPYPDSDIAVSHAVSACLSDWNFIGRLFSINCNHTLSEDSLGNLRSLLSTKNPQILNGQLLVGSCIARTLSSIANDLLRSVPNTVKKIRDSVKYVKTSELQEEKFVELKQQLQVPSERSLFIDDQTQWNTTYQMLVAASELKEVFSCLDTWDPDYTGTPSMQDWKLVETLCNYLKPLFDAVNILTTTTYPTAITFFHKVWKLQLDLAHDVTNEEDPFISELIKPMQEKIDKYWRDCSLVLAIAVVMDPRFKMKLVEFSFIKVYGDDSHEYVKIVNDGVHELFNEYVALPLPPTSGSPGRTLLIDNGLTDFDAYIMETSSQQTKSELDQYLQEPLLPRAPDFDVLTWWKLNKLRYPTLSKMARDILSVPVSSVPADSIFDGKIKEMDSYRSSLRPEVVEALVCAKDWMHYGSAEI